MRTIDIPNWIRPYLSPNLRLSWRFIATRWRILGALVSVGLLGILAGRLLLPNNGPCTLDWGVTGTWIQDFLVFVGVFVAYTQLQQLNQNERVKNTIRVYEDLSKPVMLLPGAAQQTVFGAVRDIVVTLRNADGFSAALQRGLSGHASPQDALLINTLRANVSIVHNYYDTVSSMSQRHLLDDDILFDLMAGIIKGSYKILSRMLSLDQTSMIIDSPLFRELAERAERYIEDHKARFAHLRIPDVDDIVRNGMGSSSPTQKPAANHPSI